MLATTIQITNNPLHTTHTQKTLFRLAAQATTTTRAADAHTVLNVNPTVCSSAKNFLCPTQKRTHTHHPHQVAYTCRHKKTTQHNPTGHAELFPTKLGSLERR